jgi:hypothetical protein
MKRSRRIITFSLLGIIGLLVVQLLTLMANNSSISHTTIELKSDNSQSQNTLFDCVQNPIKVRNIMGLFAVYQYRLLVGLSQANVTCEIGYVGDGIEYQHATKIFADRREDFFISGNMGYSASNVGRTLQHLIFTKDGSIIESEGLRKVRKSDDVRAILLRMKGTGGKYPSRSRIGFNRDNFPEREMSKNAANAVYNTVGIYLHKMHEFVNELKDENESSTGTTMIQTPVSMQRHDTNE